MKPALTVMAGTSLDKPGHDGESDPKSEAGFWLVERSDRAKLGGRRAISIAAQNAMGIALMSLVKQQPKPSPLQLASVGFSSSDDRARAGAKH
jgi:hypothetical protein